MLVRRLYLCWLEGSTCVIYRAASVLAEGLHLCLLEGCIFAG